MFDIDINTGCIYTQKYFSIKAFNKEIKIYITDKMSEVLKHKICDYGILHISLLYAIKGIVPKQNMGSLIRFLYPIMHKSSLKVLSK